jgi:hypothetical protein
VIASPAAAAWIAHIAFWVLLGIGVSMRELGRLSTAMFLALWLLGYMGLPRLAWPAELFVTPYIAMLDVVLAFVVLKGDVRLT